MLFHKNSAENLLKLSDFEYPEFVANFEFVKISVASVCPPVIASSNTL